EAETPARHPVALRHRKELDPDLAGAGLGEKAARRPAVEDEVAVREVVDDRRAGLVRERDGFGERPVGDARCGRVARIVEEDRGDVVARREVEAWLVTTLGI